MGRDARRELSLFKECRQLAALLREKPLARLFVLVPEASFLEESFANMTWPDLIPVFFPSTVTVTSTNGALRLPKSASQNLASLVFDNWQNIQTRNQPLLFELSNSSGALLRRLTDQERTNIVLLGDERLPTWLAATLKDQPCAYIRLRAAEEKGSQPHQLASRWKNLEESVLEKKPLSHTPHARHRSKLEVTGDRRAGYSSIRVHAEDPFGAAAKVATQLKNNRVLVLFGFKTGLGHIAQAAFRLLEKGDPGLFRVFHSSRKQAARLLLEEASKEGAMNGSGLVLEEFFDPDLTINSPHDTARFDNGGLSAEYLSLFKNAGTCSILESIISKVKRKQVHSYLLFTSRYDSFEALERACFRPEGGQFKRLWKAALHDFLGPKSVTIHHSWGDQERRQVAQGVAIMKEHADRHTNEIDSALPGLRYLTLGFLEAQRARLADGPHSPLGPRRELLDPQAHYDLSMIDGRCRPAVWYDVLTKSFEALLGARTGMPEVLKTAQETHAHWAVTHQALHFG